MTTILDTVWNIPLRRALFGWEQSQWNELVDCLANFSDGVYKVKSMRFLDENSTPSNPLWEKLVWLRLVPPKVEIFMWRVVWGRVPVKVELLKRGVPIIENSLCSLCKNSPETISHLFLFCTGVWRIWMKFCALLGVSTAFPLIPLEFLEAWMWMIQLKNMSWFSLIPFVIIWSVWLARNEVVFNRKGVDWLQLDFLVRVRLTTWMKSLFPGHDIPLDCLISGLCLALNFCKNPKRAPNSGRCCPPPCGGIGGLLRDENGKILFQFSEPAGNGPPVLMELLALSSEITGMLNSFGLVLRLIPRLCNAEADKLAKMGIG
ncbi:hypothetical protein GQ457_11G028910 [Hibiscus cannabinus]